MRRELVGWLVEGRRTVPPSAVVCRLVVGKRGRVVSQPRRLFRERDGTLSLSFPLSLSLLPFLPSFHPFCIQCRCHRLRRCISTAQGRHYEAMRPYARYRVASHSNRFGNVYFPAKKYRAESRIKLQYPKSFKIYI